MLDEERKIHPSFGVAKFSRIYGKSGFMFGSSIQSENFIELEISNAERCKDTITGTIRYHSTDSIIVVKMTQSQFAALITSMNVGEGVPITLEYVDGKQIKQLSYLEGQNHLGELKEDFKKRTKDILDKLVEFKKKINNLLDKKYLTIEDKENLKHEIDSYITEVKSNIPFFIQIYQEETDDILQKAKTEIDALIQSVIMKSGIEVLGLKKENFQLKENN